METQLEAKLNTERDTVKIKQEMCRLRNTDLRLRPGKKQTWKQKQEMKKKLHNWMQREGQDKNHIKVSENKT